MLTETERAAERITERALSMLSTDDGFKLLTDPDYIQFTTYCNLRRDMAHSYPSEGSPAFESFKANPPSGQLA